MTSVLSLQMRPDYGMGRAFALALAVHAILVAVIFLGVRWQSHPADVVSVELWEPPPPPPPVVVEAPKPPPKVVEPPKPEPPVKKPDIVVEKAPPKPKPKPEVKPKVEAKPAPPKDDEFQKRMMQEQLAMEQRKFEEDRRQAEEQRRKAEADKLARELATTARNKALDEYIGRIRNKVRQNWILPQDIQGNPQCVFKVIQLPTGEVIDVKLLKTSGHPAYDDAVYRAILKSSPLPPPASRDQFYRELELTFRPRD